MQKFWNRNSGWTGKAIVALAAGVFIVAPVGPATAQQQTAAMSHPADAAGARGSVVRLSHVEGTVQILRGGETEFSHAVMNMPLVEGSRISTGADGRAEIEFEDGSVARLTPNSALDLGQFHAGSDGALDTTAQQVSGLVYYELRSDSTTQFHVIAGGRTVTPVSNSTFRVNLDSAPANVAVIAGAVKVGSTAAGVATEVRQGKTAQFQASDSGLATIADGIVPSGFDEWNDQRDQEAAKEAANQTPARRQGGGSAMDGGIGWSDLDNNGGWYPMPGYGMMWQPFGAGPGFDPYGDGMWADMGGGFGYSWVSGYPWGWLPFHYGLWTYIGGFGWGWSPYGSPFGGYGFGYGYGGYGYGYGYGYGHRDGDRDADDAHHRHPRTNVYGGPAGYHAPTPPTVAKGSVAPRLITVGRGVVPSVSSRSGLNTARIGGGNALRPVKIAGTKVEPLHSMAAVNVPIRNAALYNNAGAHLYQGNLRTSLEGRGAMRSPAASPAPLQGSPRGAIGGGGSANHAPALNAVRGGVPAGHPLAPTNRATFGQPASSFGQHTSFGARGGFGGVQPAYRSSGGGFQNSGSAGRSGGNFGGGGFHGGGSQGGGSGGHPAGGMSGGGGGGHAGGMSSGGSQGGGMSSGGGFHGGGMSSGTGGGHTGR